MAIVSNFISTVSTNVHVSSGNTAITALYLCNKQPSTAVTVNVHIVLNGFTANANNVIYNTLTVAGKDTYIIDTEKLLLSNGDSIRAVASADGIVATASYTSI